MKGWIKGKLLLLFLFLAPSLGSAQTDEIWPEVDLFYRFNESFRLYALFSATQLKENSSYSDGQAGVHLDYFVYPFFRKGDSAHKKRGDYLWFRAGYIYSTSTPSREDAFKDHIIVTEANLKYYLFWQFRLTVKNRFDWRITENELETRYRPRLTFEHNLKTEYMTLTPYLYTEYFLNFGNSAVNKFRICGGAEFRVTKIMNTEIYYLYQFPNGDEVPTVNALGIAFKFYFPYRSRSIVGNRRRQVEEVKTETTR